MVELPHITANQTNPVYLVFLKSSVLPVRLCYATTVFRLLVYPGNAHPPSEWAMGYIGFYVLQYSVSECKCRQTIFLMHPSCRSAVSICFFIRAHAGFIIAQLKTLSISRGSQGNNYTLIGTGPFSSLGTAMCLLIKSCIFHKSCFSVQSSGRRF